MESGDDANAQLLDMMSQMMSKFDSKMNYLCDQVTTLGHRLSTMEKAVESMRGEVSFMKTENATTQAVIEQERQNIASLVCFNHAYNITFYGFPTRSDMSLQQAFRKFMVDSLHIKHEVAANMPINVQQLGRLSPQDMYPPICVSFVSTKDATSIHDKTSKHGMELKRSGIWAKWILHKGMMVKKSY